MVHQRGRARGDGGLRIHLDRLERWELEGLSLERLDGEQGSYVVVSLVEEIARVILPIQPWRVLKHLGDGIAFRMARHRHARKEAQGGGQVHHTHIRSYWGGWGRDCRAHRRRGRGAHCRDARQRPPRQPREDVRNLLNLEPRGRVLDGATVAEERKLRHDARGTARTSAHLMPVVGGDEEYRVGWEISHELDDETCHVTHGLLVRILGAVLVGRPEAVPYGIGIGEVAHQQIVHRGIGCRRATEAVVGREAPAPARAAAPVGANGPKHRPSPFQVLFHSAACTGGLVLAFRRRRDAPIAIEDR